MEAPRILFALNNGAIGAPNLSKRAYSGNNIEKQLNTAASQYINSLRGVQLIGDKLVTSSLFRDYQQDFGKTSADVITQL